jgi:macrolide transport system ATP-binding/permease protein
MEEKAAIKGIDISDLKLMPYLYNEFSSSDEFIKTFMMIFLISLFILIIAALNIIHIAIASIMDREREIGLKTALGARTYHIIKEIVGEIFICVLKGGMVGVAIASVINTLANIYFRGLTFSFNIITIIAGMLLAAIAGLLTSLIPAKKAAELDPSAALREE